MFSRRFHWDLTPNRLSEALAQRRAEGLPVLDLTASNPTQVGFAYPQQAIQRALGRPEMFTYAPDPQGLRRAREAVAAYYAAHGATVSPERIFLTSSSSEGYSWLFKLLTDPGDEVLIPQPSYPLFGFLARLENVAISGYALEEADGRWQFDEMSLKLAGGPRTRAVVVVHPNNPTGHFTRAADRAVLEEFARKRRAALIIDEVFADYVLGAPPDRVPTFAGGSSVLTFTLSGLSKVAALPQLKLGWIVVDGPDEEVREASARLELIADTYLSVATPVQTAAGDLLTGSSAIREQIVSRCARNLGRLRQTIPSGVRLLEPEGGWYAVLEAPGVEIGEDLCLRLLEEDGVLLHPGFFFDFHSPSYAVISLLGPGEEFETAAAGLLTQLKTS